MEHTGVVTGFNMQLRGNTSAPRARCYLVKHSKCHNRASNPETETRARAVALDLMRPACSYLFFYRIAQLTCVCRMCTS